MLTYTPDDSSGPLKRRVTVMGRKGITNPTPDDYDDTYWIDDYWFAPEFFDIEIIGENQEWDADFIKGEIGALKRFLIHMTMFQSKSVDINPFSLLVCIENMQRYYKNKLKECQKIPTTNLTQESITETP